MTVRVITNNNRRPIVEAWELTEAERKQFDYLDWDKIEHGEESAQFVRYKGDLIDLGEFSADYGIARGSGLPDHLAKWHGYRSDSFFSALVVRWLHPDDDEHVIIGLVLS